MEPITSNFSDIVPVNNYDSFNNDGMDDQTNYIYIYTYIC